MGVARDRRRMTAWRGAAPAGSAVSVGSAVPGTLPPRAARRESGAAPRALQIAAGTVGTAGTAGVGGACAAAGK